MNDHVHTGVVTALYVVVVAIVGINLVRFGAAWLANHDQTATVGKAVGGLVTFGG